MSDVLSGIFGGRPSKPKPVIPTREVKQDLSERDRILKELGKRRRATLTSELSQANIKRQRLGAGI